MTDSGQSAFPREVVLAAHAWLIIDSAAKYGLIEGGPTINVGRCQEIIDSSGEDFDQDEIDAAALALVSHVNEEAAE